MADGRGAAFADRPYAAWQKGGMTPLLDDAATIGRKRVRNWRKTLQNRGIPGLRSCVRYWLGDDYLLSLQGRAIDKRSISENLGAGETCQNPPPEEVGIRMRREEPQPAPFSEPQGTSFLSYLCGRTMTYVRRKLGAHEFAIGHEGQFL